MEYAVVVFQGALPPGRLRRLKFDTRYVPPPLGKILFGPLLARLWRRR